VQETSEAGQTKSEKIL